MKKAGLLLLIFVFAFGTLAFVGCAVEDEPVATPEEDVGEAAFYWSNGELADGDYRGAYTHAGGDRDFVIVQITVEDEVVVDTSVRDMTYRGIVWDPEGSHMPDGSEVPEDNQWMQYAGQEGMDLIAEQHYQALYYLEGAEGLEEIRERTQEMEGNPGYDTDLYEFIEPKEVEGEQIDTFSAATIRSDKVGSAIRDAINRGVYR
ncbi:hypothetical protein [Natranaerofaba carboxydovora]|uniref:hypothetical protein n=1 Tax=Natranaerofaba carboxydovora TaxID=2742683 RepID=UPI001F13197E|nr:hypothetical protein [Natranaerofaba carboxydovora]UMZ72665.1 hypothetical protein ACONDI_00189 [Natranaerofaba carboxydovora]